MSSGAAPFLKIISASEQPVVFTDDSGVLTITPETCDVEPTVSPTTPAFVSASVPTLVPTASAPVASSAVTSWSFSAIPLLSYFLPNAGKMLSPFVMLTLFGSFHLVQGVNNGCVPTLEIEISIPQAADVTTKFGETDHYLAATVDTVVWGYYDPNATAAITMSSGETITVEVITHHGGHDYAKMIRGDPAVEEIFYWEETQSLLDKPEPKLPGTGVHIITGPIEVAGAEPGDIVEVEILELEPRYNPSTGRCFGTNSQKFAGYQYRIGTKRDGTPYVRTGGTEAITVLEFLEDDDGKMLYAKPVYMYRFPNMTAPDGSLRTFDNNPAVTVPHEYNIGYNGEFIDADPIEYPPGFDDTVVSQSLWSLLHVQ
jgi:hypothetical protein